MNSILYFPVTLNDNLRLIFFAEIENTIILMIDQKFFLFLITLTPPSVDLLLPIFIRAWIAARIQSFN